MTLPKAIAVVLTASKVESEVVMRNVKSKKVIEGPAGTTYQIGTIEFTNKEWVIVVAEIGSKSIEQSVLTTRAISFFEPDIIIFVDSPANLKPYKLGDVRVVLPDSTKKGEINTLLWDKNDNSNFYLSDINQNNSWQTWTYINEKYNERYGKLINKIKENGRLFEDEIKETDVSGFLFAAQLNKHEGAYVIQGIMDKPAEKASKFQKSMATALAAIVMRKLVAQRIPKKKLIENLDNNVPGTNEILQLLSENFKVVNPDSENTNQSYVPLDFGSFADAGLFIEVISEKTLGRELDEFQPRELCQVATLCQKAGFLDAAWIFLFEALGRKQSDVAELNAVKVHSYWLALRLFSQSGNTNGVLDNYRQVIAWLKWNNEGGKIAPIYSRAGIAYAIDGNLIESQKCFEEATKHAEKGNYHQKLTVKVLWALAASFKKVKFNEVPLDIVCEAQYQYLVPTKTNGQLAQAYPLKSTLQCLYAEAAILLFDNSDNSDNREAAKLRLLAASIVRHRAYSHPKAEGFAELISLMPEGMNKKTIMYYMDPSLRISEKHFNQESLEKCRELLKLFNFNEHQWKEVRKSIGLESDD